MSRFVEHDATGPLKLDESDIDAEKGDIAVCQCGLSVAYPFCDGTHRKTENEAEDDCYRYVRRDGELVRLKVDQLVYAEGTDGTIGSTEDTVEPTDE